MTGAAPIRRSDNELATSASKAFGEDCYDISRFMAQNRCYGHGGLLFFAWDLTPGSCSLHVLA